ALLFAPGVPKITVADASGGGDPRTSLRVEGSGGARPRISYELPEAVRVRLDVYDAAGRYVARLADAPQVAGPHVFAWDPTHHASGVYFVRLEADARIEAAQLVARRGSRDSRPASIMCSRRSDLHLGRCMPRAPHGQCTGAAWRAAVAAQRTLPWTERVDARRRAGPSRLLRRRSASALRPRVSRPLRPTRPVRSSPAPQCTASA